MCERISRTHLGNRAPRAGRRDNCGFPPDLAQGGGTLSRLPRVGQQVMNAADHYVLIEFCCPICLRSIRSPDTDRIPRCERCLIRMEPDSDEPPRRSPTRPVMAGRDRE